MNERAALRDLVVGPLVRSAFSRPSAWSRAVAIVRPEGRRVTSRGDFAAWLSANGLHASARECLRREIRRGSLLCWLEVDAPNIAAAGFVVLDLAAALRDSSGVGSAHAAPLDNQERPLGT